MQTIVENRKALFNYQVLDKLKAGIVLQGQEVKAIKNGKVSLRGAFVALRDEEVFLIGAKISPYQPENTPNDYNPQRPRKLLLKKYEIKHLIGKAKQRGLTMVPLRVYNERGKIKIEFAIAAGKKKVDKREEIKKREAEREIMRALKR